MHVCALGGLLLLFRIASACLTITYLCKVFLDRALVVEIAMTDSLQRDAVARHANGN